MKHLLQAIKKYAKNIKHLGVIGLGLYGSAMIAFIVQGWLARFLSIEEFGSYASLMALLTICSVLSSFGVGRYILHLNGLDRNFAVKWGKVLTQILLCGLILGSGLMLVFSKKLLSDSANLSPAYLLPHLILMSLQLVVLSISQIEEKHAQQAFVQLLPNLTRLVAIAFCILFIEPTIEQLFSVYGALSVVGAAYFMFLLLKKFEFFFFKKGRRPKAEWRDLHFFSYGITAMAMIAYAYIDVILAKTLSSEAVAAKIAVINAVFMLIYMLPRAVLNEYLASKINIWIDDSPELILEVIKKYKILVIMGALIAILVSVGNQWIFGTIFGDQYANISNFVYILALAIPARFLIIGMGVVYCRPSDVGYQKNILIISLMVKVIAAIFLTKLSPEYGVPVAVIISEVLLVSLYYHGIRHRITRRE